MVIYISFTKGDSKFYVLMNNGVAPRATGGSHWLTYHPGYMYCFVPSYHADKGSVYAYDYLPEFLSEFSYCAEIKMVTFDHIGGDVSNNAEGVNSNKRKVFRVNKSNQGRVHRGNKEERMYGSNDSNGIKSAQSKGHKSNGARLIGSSTGRQYQYGDGQGASPGQQGDQKPEECHRFTDVKKKRKYKLSDNTNNFVLKYNQFAMVCNTFVSIFT